MRSAPVGALVEAAAVLTVLQAWRVFKASHDLTKAEHCCCEKTQALFTSLAELDKEVLGDVGS